MSYFTKVQLVDDTEADINADNPLSVEIPPLVSTVNSTSTPLGADATFPGTAERCNGYGIIYVNIYSDVASAVDGLKIEQSSDGTNWDHCDEFSILAAKGKNFSINPYAKWYRIRYVNGAIDQTVFRLQTILKSTGLSSSHRISDDIIDDDDAILVKSVLTGKDSDSHFHNVNVTHDGDLSISDNSSGLAIAQRNVTGTSSQAKFGFANDFDATDNTVTVWDGAANGTAWELMNYIYSTTADIDSISSSNAGDATEVTIIGLDANYAEVEQTVTLNGQTRVALTTPLVRVYRAYNDNGTVFIGTVAIYVNTALTAGLPTDKTKIRAIITPDAQQTLMAVYTVPAGKTAYLTRGYASTAGASKSSEYIIKFYVRNFGKVFRLQNINSISDTGNSVITLDYFVPLKISEKSDLEVRVQATAGGTTAAAVSAGFDLILVDN